MIFDLVKDGGKIIGALGFNFRTGKPIGFCSPGNHFGEWGRGGDLSEK